MLLLYSIVGTAALQRRKIKFVKRKKKKTKRSKREIYQFVVYKEKTEKRERKKVVIMTAIRMKKLASKKE